MQDNLYTNSSYALRLYLKEIKNEKSLSIEEEIILIKKIREGDRNSLNKFLKSNLKYVIMVAKKYNHCGVPLADLISEGNLGMIKAVEKFDETRGFKFISYATWWIEQAISHFIKTHSRVVRLPENIISNMGKMKKAITVFESLHGRIPTTREIETILDLENISRETLYIYNEKMIDLDAPVGSNKQDKKSTLQNIIPDDSPEFLSDEMITTDINELFQCLSLKEAKVLNLHFWERWDLAAISQELNLS